MISLSPFPKTVRARAAAVRPSARRDLTTFFKGRTIRRLAAAAASAASLALAACEGGDAPPPASNVGGPYVLVDQTGETRTPDDFAGRPVIYYFGFTHCPDVCPPSLSLLSAALDRLEGAVDVQPIFVTVDPERDTPEALRDYLSWDDRFIGLTGDPASLRPVYESYRIYVEKIPLEDSALGHTVDHSSLFLLFDRRHRFIRPFSDKLSPEELAEAVRAAL